MKSTDILQILKNNLVENEGIYFSKSTSEISYPETGNDHCFQIEQNSFWFKHRNNCITESVLKYASNEVFIDIGGGNGYVAKGLKDNGILTILVEPGIQGCRNAVNRGVEYVVCATLEDTDLQLDFAGAAGLFDVVEHIEDDLNFLKTVHQILKPNGLVFITVPAFNFLWSDEDDVAGHFRRYTRKTLRKKLEDAGFKVVYSTYIFSILPIAVFFFRTIPSKLGINKKSSDLAKHQKEHEVKKGILSRIVDAIWNLELRKIKAGKTMPIGGSCFIVARKPNL